MANTKISQLTNLTTPTGSEEFVYAYNNANGKITLDTMKTFVGGAGITTLNADANIWELTDGIYETEYQLYYKSGETVPATSTGSGRARKQMVFVTEETGGAKGFLVFSAGGTSGTKSSYSSYGYSLSSSVGTCYQLGSRDWSLNQYENSSSPSVSSLDKNNITQFVEDAESTNYITLGTGTNTPYVGMTYTIYISSVMSGQNYEILLGTGVTNPLNLTLPTNSTKKCVITVLITSTTTAIVTGCTIES